MADEPDDFDGIDINGPWGGVRIGSGRGRRDLGGDPEYRNVRRRVRRRLQFYRQLSMYSIIVGGLALLDWATGGGWWVQWVAAIWGAVLALQFVNIFIAPYLWGRDVEERMVHREMERRRGRATVTPPPPDDQRE